MSGKVYEADGPIIRKLPVETKTETGVKISIGFPVCRLTEWCDDQGEALAEIMNRGESHASSQAEIERLTKALADIAAATDPDDPESYRSDDREGCLDTVQAIARAALSGSKE